LFSGVFNYDPDYLENEEKYKEIKLQILGENSDDDDDGESGTDDSDDDEDENEENEEELIKKMEIHDQTNTNLITLRKTIYLTIKSSLDFEECCHKLMKLNIQEGQEAGFHFILFIFIYLLSFFCYLFIY
jgi:pre-mRNA-splicing factor CWC22